MNFFLFLSRLGENNLSETRLSVSNSALDGQIISVLPRAVLELSWEIVS